MLGSETFCCFAQIEASSPDYDVPGTIFVSTAESFREESSYAQQFVLGLRLLDADTSLEDRAFINGDASGHDVVHGNGRLL
jgi:hypothetical protein